MRALCRAILRIAPALVLLGSTGALASDAALASARSVGLGQSDRARAHAIVLRRADLGGGSDWKGGPMKLDLAGASKLAAATCPDLTATGPTLHTTAAAGSAWASDGLGFVNAALIFRTDAMAAADVGVLARPGSLTCVRHLYETVFGTTGTIETVERLAFPDVAPGTFRFRVTARTTRRMVFDIVGFRHGRTEVQLLTATPFAHRHEIVAAEIHLARVLARRVAA